MCDYYVYKTSDSAGARRNGNSNGFGIYIVATESNHNIGKTPHKLNNPQPPGVKQNFQEKLRPNAETSVAAKSIVVQVARVEISTEMNAASLTSRVTPNIGVPAVIPGSILALRPAVFPTVKTTAANHVGSIQVQ